MIRHHVAQDLLSAEVAPQYLGAGMLASPPAALLSGPVETRGGDGLPHAAAPSHPFAYYASPLSTVVLLVMSVIALSALVRQRRQSITLRRIRDRYRDFLGAPIAAPTACTVAGNS